MKKIFMTLILFFLSINLFADSTYESPMSLYKENYFIAGNKENQVKFQFSAKYNLVYPSKLGIYAAYSQRSLWYLYNESSPFIETNYMPEVFFRFESKNNFLGDKDLGFIDYIQISPISHCSNGRDGLESRSINTFYAQVQVSIGEHYNFGTNVKIFGYWNKACENPDIEKYLSYYETDLFFKLKSESVKFLDKEELHFKFGGLGTSDYDSYKKDKKIYGWYCIEGRIRIITTRFQPQLFIQYYRGYAQWLVNYNEKEKSLRAGIVF